MARPAVVALVMLLGLTHLYSGRSQALAQEGPPTASPSHGVVYGGPAALFDPQDPLQGLRWTLGLTLPRRNLLVPGRTPDQTYLDYDLSRHRVLLSYRSGTRDILPPIAFTGEGYGNFALGQKLRQSWILDTKKVMAESKARADQGGKLNVALPFELPFTRKIFGEGAPNLRVSGSEQITISGSSSWVVGQVTGERGGGSLFPKLDMRQRLNVNLQGTIGSKLFVDVAQNSDALTPLENSMKIRYRGGEDEIVQSVELGNTNLSLPPTQFISFSARQEGLFGVKTTAKVGGIDLTAIASRQEGETGAATFVGGSQERTARIQDFQFLRGKFFFLADPDSALVPTNVVEVRLYLDDKAAQNDVELGAQLADVWLDPELRTPDPVRGRFHLLLEGETEDYRLLNSGTESQSTAIPQLVLNNPVQPNQTLAVAYRYVVGVDTVKVGTFNLAPGDTVLDLKMLRPSEGDWDTDVSSDLRTSRWAPARRLELKNAYDLKTNNIDPGSFDLVIVQDIAGEDGENPFTIENEFGRRTALIEVLGLDQKNNADASDRTPDGRVDPEYIDYENGILFFPDLRPFDPSLVDIEGGPPGFRSRSWPRTDGASRPDTLGWTRVGNMAVPSKASVREDETVPEIYDLLYSTLSTRFAEHHIYTIEVTTKSSSAGTIRLNTFGNILEGSETVRLNGEVLTRGQDYTIFYDSGEVTLKHPDASSPDADLVITYSYDPLFSRGSRSLLGGSIATRQDQNAKLSFSTSWLHESQGTADRRPRLGQEPTKTTVGDVSGRLRLEPWALTDMVDALPLISTNAPSRLEISGALGVSLPNPNTRDVVYVDDMEGAEVINSPGVSRGVWFYSSPPRRAIDYRPGGTQVFYEPQPADRGQLLWFSPNTVEVKDITPREDSDAQRDDLVPVLEVIYIPQSAGDPVSSWGGLVTSMSRDGIDVSRSQFLEIWINDYINHSNQNARRGEILIDVGTVSEDAVWDPLTPPAPPNGALDVEDKNQSEDQIEVDEDVGLDGKRNDAEPPFDPAKLRMTPISSQTDPAGDDRVRDIETNLRERNPTERVAKYRGINGTEGNDLSDGEDLNGDFLLDLQNNYSEYRVDLAAPAFQDVGRDFGVTDPQNGWRLYRIPLDEFHLEEGIANLSKVRHMRLWFRGVDPGDTLDVQVASIEIIGNRWESADSLKFASDELFNISVVNNKENADYIEPFGVERINNVKEREQSVSLDFENFRAGNEVRAFKRLSDVQDYTLYQNLAFYLNPRFQSMPGDSVEFYLRFSSDASNDSLSYYEVATVISEDDMRRRADRWLDLRFEITELSRIKIGSTAVRADSFLVGPGDTGAHPRVDLGNGLKASIRGNPSFSRVRRISVGLRNISGRDLPRGSVWFNELRMGQVRKDRGYASRASLSLRLADFISFSSGVDLTSADFLRLGQTRGTGTENLRYDLRGEVGLHKLVEGARLNMPLSLNLTKSRQTPKFRPNSDVLFDGSESGREISQSLSRRASLSIARSGRGSGLSFYTIDAIRLSGTASEIFQESVTRSDSTYQRSGNASYNLSLAQWKPLTLLNRFDFWFWPKSVQATVAGSRSESRVWSPEANNQLRLTNNSLTRTGSLNLASNFQPIKGLVYSWGSTRDLIDAHFGPDSSVVRLERPSRKILGVDIGREISQTHNLTFNYTPPYLGQSLKPRFTWSSGSTQNSGPGLTLENFDRSVFNINNNNSGSVSLALPVNSWVNKLTGRSRPEAGGGRTRPARPSQGKSAADTTGADEGDKGGGSKNQIRKLFTQVMRFQPAQLSGTLARRSAYERINGAPPLEYRLGLTRDIGLGTDVVTVENASFNQLQGQTVTIRGNTTVTLFQELGLDMTYQKRKDRTESNVQVRLEDTTTWPEVRFNWGEIHKKIPIIRSIFSEFQAVSTNYSKTTTTSGTEENPDESISVATNWRPLISLQGELGSWRTTLAANHSNTSTVSRRLGAAGTTNERSQTNYQIGFSKTFQRGNTGKSIDLKIDLSYAVNNSETRSSSQLLPRQDKREQIRINTSAGIKLTRTMSGTFGLELGQESRPTTDYTRRNVRVFFSTGFSF